MTIALAKVYDQNAKKLGTIDSIKIMAIYIYIYLKIDDIVVVYGLFTLQIC